MKLTHYYSNNIDIYAPNRRGKKRKITKSLDSCSESSFFNPPRETNRPTTTTLAPPKMLTEQQAVDIYKYKLSLMAAARSDEDNSRPAEILLRSVCEDLAKHYGLTIRAIQDIWNRRSWAYATHHLWEQGNDGQDSKRKFSAISAAEVRDSDMSPVTQKCWL